MKTLSLLTVLYGYVNGEYCTASLSDSDCYNTEIKDSTIYCYGYRSCYSSLLEATDTINCGGAYACYYAEGIESSSGSIYCAGDYGCSYSSGEIEAWSGNIYCDGNSGCYNVQSDIQGNDIYCTGDYGCYSTDGNITALDDIYCDGNYACYYVGGTISGTDVSVRGYNGARKGTIVAKHDVSCSGDYSCYYADITAGDDVTFNGQYSGYYATVTAKDIECSGKYSCYRSTLSVPGGAVDIYGYRAGYYSTITAKDVNVYSYYGAYRADITSTENSSLTISLYAYYSGYYMNAYCLSGSQCMIKCLDNKACYRTYIYYYGSIDSVSIFPNDCIDNAGTTNDDNVYCPHLVSSSTTNLQKFQKMSKTHRDNDPQSVNFEQEIAEDFHKMEQRRKADDGKRAKHEEAIIDNMYFNAQGVVNRVGIKKLNNSIYGSIFGGLITFLLLYCYYSHKVKDLKYESLS